MGIFYSCQMGTGKLNLVITHPTNNLDLKKASAYRWKQSGCGDFANVIFLVNTHKRVSMLPSAKLGPECQLHKNITTAHRCPFSTTMSIARGLSLTLTMCFSKPGPFELQSDGSVICVHLEKRLGQIFTAEGPQVCVLGPRLLLLTTFLYQYCVCTDEKQCI